MHTREPIPVWKTNSPSVIEEVVNILDEKRYNAYMMSVVLDEIYEDMMELMNKDIT